MKLARLLAWPYLSLAALVACGSNVGWESVEARVEALGVRRISTAELQRRLEAGEDILLLDVRTEPEFRVSHLAGAVRVEDPAAAAELVKQHAGPVVAYCAVGVRSAELVKELNGAPVDLWNLAGSIFAWANEGRPLVDADGQPTRWVHPYDERWGRLLERELWALEPPR